MLKFHSAGTILTLFISCLLASVPAGSAETPVKGAPLNPSAAKTSKHVSEKSDKAWRRADGNLFDPVSASMGADFEKSIDFRMDEIWALPGLTDNQRVELNRLHNEFRKNVRSTRDKIKRMKAEIQLDKNKVSNKHDSGNELGGAIMAGLVDIDPNKKMVTGRGYVTDPVAAEKSRDKVPYMKRMREMKTQIKKFKMETRVKMLAVLTPAQKKKLQAGY